MRDRLPQPSQIAFPSALQPAQYEDTPAVVATEQWGWIETFVLIQVFWGLLLFLPGSQAYRTYIRAFPYVISLVALAACSRSTGAEASVPGARWMFAVFALLICSLPHPDTWLAAGIAQIVFQLAIAAPVFWAGRTWLSERRLDRILWLVFAANFLGAALGLLQVYYPDTFLPPQFSALAVQMNPDLVGSLTYIGAGQRAIIRPPGLSDLPGGAAIAGTIAAIVGFTFAMRSRRQHFKTVLYLGAVVIAVTCLYLTQVRSLLLLIVVAMGALAFIRARQGHVVQSGWVAASAGALILGSFAWAVTVGGEAVQERFGSLLETGVFTTYQDNRGFFLDHTVKELLFEYPFGAGVGRWGMMTVYFQDPQSWQRPALYAEIQPTGWLYDGGVLMWLFYGGALFVAMRHTYKLAVDRHSHLKEFATLIFLVQLMISGLALTGPVFNNQIGLLFWLLTAVLYARERTAAIEDWTAASNAEAEAETNAVTAG